MHLGGIGNDGTKVNDQPNIRLGVDVEPEITRFSLVALSYQPPLNPSIRSYVIYLLTFSITYHYYVHNSSNLTINRLDWILPTKQTKNR